MPIQSSCLIRVPMESVMGPLLNMVTWYKNTLLDGRYIIHWGQKKKDKDKELWEMVLWSMRKWCISENISPVSKSRHSKQESRNLGLAACWTVSKSWTFIIRSRIFKQGSRSLAKSRIYHSIPLIGYLPARCFWYHMNVFCKGSSVHTFWRKMINFSYLLPIITNVETWKA